MTTAGSGVKLAANRLRIIANSKIHDSTGVWQIQFLGRSELKSQGDRNKVFEDGVLVPAGGEGACAIGLQDGVAHASLLVEDSRIPQIYFPVFPLIAYAGIEGQSIRARYGRPERAGRNGALIQDESGSCHPRRGQTVTAPEAKRAGIFPLFLDKKAAQRSA